MNSSQQSDSFGVVDYTGVLRRRWWLVLVVTVICLIGAVGYVVVAPKTYTSTAAVFVSPTGADAANQVANSRTGGGQVNLDTEAQVVTSGTVESMAGKLMHSSLTPYQLGKQILVTVPANSQVLDIACSASTANSAATCANDFASAYLSYRSTQAASSLATQITALKAQVNSMQKTVSTLGTEISTLPSNSPTRANDTALQRNDQTLLTSLNNQLATLEGDAANTVGGHVLTAALPPGNPTAPSKTLALPSGLLAGILLGLIAAFFWDRRDKRLHTSQDVERLLNLPVMVSLSRKAFSQQVSLASPRSRTGKSFTELAHAVAASLGEGSHIVLTAGATSGPATSVVAANLAATLARTHSEAVLVCADLDNSVAPEMFGLAEDSRGLAEVAAGRATVGEVARGPASVPGLWVIPPGADTSLAEYNLQHDTAKALTSQLRRDARYIVLEAQAGDDGADTFVLAEFADAAVLVIEAGRTTKNQANEAIRRLQRMRTPLLGAVVLAPIGPRVNVRPPQPLPPGLASGRDKAADSAVSGRGRGEQSALSGTPAHSDRPAGSRSDYHDPADRIAGR
jgi:capsular polysaccharide biosynthesis protein